MMSCHKDSGLQMRNHKQFRFACGGAVMQLTSSEARRTNAEDDGQERSMTASPS